MTHQIVGKVVVSRRQVAPPTVPLPTRLDAGTDRCDPATPVVVDIPESPHRRTMTRALSIQYEPRQRAINIAGACAVVRAIRSTRT